MHLIVVRGREYTRYLELGQENRRSWQLYSGQSRKEEPETAEFFVGTLENLWWAWEGVCNLPMLHGTPPSHPCRDR